MVILLTFGIVAVSVVVAVTVCFLALLRVRVEDTRRSEDAAAQRYRDVSNREHAEKNNRLMLEKMQYDYALQQLAFARRVLDLYEHDQWEGDVTELIAAATRQLNGTPPPHNANPIAIRKEYDARRQILDLEVRRF